MELFRKSLRSLWEDENQRKESVPEVVERNMDFLCTRDLDYLINLANETELNELCYQALIECLTLVGKRCPSHERKVVNALEKLTDHKYHVVSEAAEEALETLSRPSMAPVMARFPTE